MQDLEIKRLQMFIKVEEFFKTYGNYFQSLFVKGKLAEVESVVRELNQYASLQISGNKAVRQNSSAKAALRSELREDMIAISRMARSIALVNRFFDDKFRMPQYGSDQLLLSSAVSFINDAAPVADEFIKREMPADFLEKLQASVDLFNNAIREKTQGTSAQVAASAFIDDAIERGMNAVRQLDPVVRIKFEDNPGALAAWLNANHTERVSRSSAQPKPPTPQPPTPQS